MSDFFTKMMLRIGATKVALKGLDEDNRCIQKYQLLAE
jgi:hypothetical protein